METVQQPAKQPKMKENGKRTSETEGTSQHGISQTKA
jgi:hypothetical protein